MCVCINCWRETHADTDMCRDCYPEDAPSMEQQLIDEYSVTDADDEDIEELMNRQAGGEYYGRLERGEL